MSRTYKNVPASYVKKIFHGAEPCACHKLREPPTYSIHVSSIDGLKVSSVIIQCNRCINSRHTSLYLYNVKKEALIPLIPYIVKKEIALY